jgi:hypothetical protein
MHHLPREVLGKRDRHRTSTKFRLGIIRWVHELFKRLSYFYFFTQRTETVGILHWREPSCVEMFTKKRWLISARDFNKGTSHTSSARFSIALGCELDDRGSRVWLPEGAGNFSLNHRVQNGSGAHPASYPMGTGDSFPGDKAAGTWNWSPTSV